MHALTFSVSFSSSVIVSVSDGWILVGIFSNDLLSVGFYYIKLIKIWQ